MIQKAGKSIVILTGAGVSADSGIATFRGAGGLWEGHRIEDVATPEAWERNPALVWRFYQLRRAALATVEPNAAHRALARLESEYNKSGDRLCFITQNVDNLHERAGSSPLHMHGELARLRCERCQHVFVNLDYLNPSKFLACDKCTNSRVRPDIVWFGEMPYFLDDIYKSLRTVDLFISIGTSGVVYPAAGFLAEARERGARTIVNSLDEPGNLHPRDEFLPGRASEVVPALVERILEGDF